MKAFYITLGLVAVIGVGILGYLMARPKDTGLPANIVISPSDTAGFAGYLLGSDSAIVEVTEYSDYQCPFCQGFALIQFPTVKERLIDAGLVRWRYRDFPLEQHPAARVAAHSTACADEQGRYWEQHHAVFEGQSEWAEARNPAKEYRSYARRLGLDLGAYDECMRSGRYAGRIQASVESGVRIGVSSTPTFLLNGRPATAASVTYDRLKALVDSLSAPAAP
jgi:protein-disulfide isomerase